MNTQAMSTTAPSLSAASRLRDGDFANAVRRHRMMVFLRRPPPGTTEPMVQAVAEAGVNIVEFTLDGTDTLASIRRWRDSAVPFVGAGTCRTTDDMDAAADAGAQFIVTPGYRPHVVDKALSINMPCIIGAMTATEIESAWDDGATFVKLFPGAYLGREIPADHPDAPARNRDRGDRWRRCSRCDRIHHRGRGGGRRIDRPAWSAARA